MNLSNLRVVAAVPAVDINRARKFYTETLGLKEVKVDAPDTYLFEGSDGTGITVYGRQEGTKADHTTAIWVVDDVHKAVDDLQAKGVKFEKYDMPNLKTDENCIAQLGGEQTAWFKDSEGNIMAVSTAS